MKRNTLIVLFLLLVPFAFQAQVDSGLISYPETSFLKDSLRKEKRRGDSTFLFNFYSYLGISTPLKSFAKSSNEFNNLGKSDIGINFKAGIELFINSKNTVSLDYDLMRFSVKNDALTEFIKIRTSIIYNGQYNDGSFPGNFQVNINNFGIGYSRILYFGKFSIQVKIVPSSGSLRYNYVAIYATPYSGLSSTTPVLDPGNYYFKQAVFFTFKPELNLKYVVYKRKYLAVSLNAGISYYYIHPVLSLTESIGPVMEITSFTDKITSVNTYFGVNLILRKTRI